MSMNRPRFNMGRADWIGVEALGVPGQRTFRLLVQNEESSAQIWLEKFQLQELAEGIARMFLKIDLERGQEHRPVTEELPNPKPPNFPASPEIELHVGKLTLRYDPERDLIALDVLEADALEGDAPVFRCLTTRRQMETLQSNSLIVVASGRPLCPLCGTPLSNPGMPHFCPQTNGHQKLTGDAEAE
jgi:uncharacterized repeat protein (TIGR03847 family)